MKTSNSLVLGIVLCFFVGTNSGKECAKRLSTSKLVCYYSNLEDVDGCYCTHVVLPANSDVKGIERAKERAKGVKVYVSVNEFNQGLINLLKSSKVDGLELNLRKLDSKNDITDFISTVKTKIGSDLDIALSVPAKADLVAKYFDFKALSKHADLFILQTAFLGASTNVTFHPSRLSGMWDMQNTDSVVDLVSGLGAPLSKLVVTAPVQAFQFTLQNEEYTAPGSPALELQSITRNELCQLMHVNKNWTLERDEDQAGPYIFSKNQWIAFEDSKSMDIKTKYSRVRGLAGIALKDLAQDGGSGCGSSILEAAYNGLSRQARAPRGAVLHSLEREIVDSSAKTLDSVQLSPYRISRIIDTEGKIHVTRQDSRTEFQCSRQGYFVHPRSCNRFYRCVKFDQLSDDYNVFEFDCPAGLAFDERVEVCVWPGSLPHGTPCSGSSEIAPVPRTRFVCPSEPGYYPDPENCRWFFACLDHGKSPLSAYEFRCPFGLVFDGDRLVCEWSWLVPKCAAGSALGAGLDSEYYYGGGGSGQGLEGQQVLQGYDGLGALGVIKLGGVAGKIEKPIATVYSNVGAGTLGLGYQNSGGYIEGGGGALSYKASQALQNAGLLKVNNGIGYHQGTIYTSTGQVVDAAGYLQHSDQANNVEAFLVRSGGQAGEAGLHATVNGYQGGQGAISTQSFSQYNGAGGGGGYQGGKEAISTQSFSQYNGAGEGQFYATAEGANNLDASGKGAISTQSFTQYHGSGVQSGGYEGLSKQNVGAGYINVGGSNSVGGSDAISNQIFTQYHGQGQTKNVEHFGNGIAGSINIIGGGFSAVGPLAEGIQISNRGEGDVKTVSFSSSPGLVAVTTAAPEPKIVSVPIVRAVPVPGIKSIVGFETIAGGVIANVPELQYKVSSLEEAGLFKNFSTSFANFVVTPTAADEGHSYSQGAGYVHGDLANTVTVSTARPFVAQPEVYVSSTIKPLTVVQEEGYQKPSISSTPKPVSFQTYTKIPSVAFEEPKPAVFVEQQPQIAISSTAAPPAVSTYTSRENPAVISKFTIRKPVQSGGFYYENPSVKFDSVQLKQNTYQQPAVVSQYYYQQPVVKKERLIPLYQQPESFGTYTYQPPVQKQPVTQYTYQNVAAQAAGVGYNAGGTSYQYTNLQNQQSVSKQAQGGYVYNKPSIVFEEKPQVTVVNDYQYSTPKPAVIVQETKGYVYDKPSVAFEESPTVTYSTPKPVEAPAEPAVVTSYFNIDTSKSNGGYTYSKPNVHFEEAPVVTYSTPKPVEAPAQPAVVTSYFNIDTSKSNGGYTYSKPNVQFEEAPVVTYTTPKSVEAPAQPAVVTSYFNVDTTKSDNAQANVGYAYSKPNVHFEEAPVVTYSTPKPVEAPAQPAVVSSYFNIDTSKSNGGYTYSKPNVQFEEAPVVTYSTPKPVEAPAQPAIVTSYFNIDTTKSDNAQANAGYAYSKPNVHFEEAPVVTHSTPKPVEAPAQPAVVTSYFNIDTSKSNGGYTYSNPKIQFENTPVVTYSTPKPVEAPAQPAIVTSYFNIDTTKSKNAQANVGYAYPKPDIQFEETPVFVSSPKPAVVANSYSNYAGSKANSQQQSGSYVYHQETPVIYSTPKPVGAVQPPQPAVVSSYFNIGGSKTEIEDQERVGYTYQKPSVAFEEAPVQPAVVPSYYSTPKPAVVSSYSYIASTTSKPVVVESIEHTTPQPNIIVEQQPQVILQSTPKPAVISSYFHQQPSKGYEYPKPTVQFEDGLQFVKTGQYQENYNYQHPSGEVVVETTPSVVNYFHQQPSKSYEYPKATIKFQDGVQEVPFVKKTAYVTGQYQQQHSQEENYNYQHSGDGKVIVENYQFPEYEKVKQAVFGQKIYQEQPQVVINYTPKPTLVSTIKTIAKKKLQPVTPATVTIYDSRYSSTPESYISSTIAPEVFTSRPISRYSFSSLDDQYQYNSIVKSSTDEPQRAYLPATSTVKITSALPITKTKVVEEYVAPEVTTLARDYLPVRTRTTEYAPVYRTKLQPVEVTTPSQVYLPVPTKEYLPSRRVKVTTAAPEITTLNREYLPVRARVKITTTEAPTYTIKSRRPSPTINLPKPVTVIKQNDAHPLLSAKLGAQCTCVSNTLKLRKKQKIIIVEDDNDDDGYVVDDDAQGNAVESYSYEPEKVVVDITPTPQVYVQKKRVKVNPTTELSEIFYKKNTSPALSVEDSAPSDREIAKAVRTGLKLVKQAAKEGAKEGTHEVLSKQQFDRYGPGGVRSRSESLQGTIDCQRAGLFRHPTECNKFYACRWDCTKKRFTLHVFNCPVHLTFDNTLGACNWPSQGPACVENTLITSD